MGNYGDVVVCHIRAYWGTSSRRRHFVTWVAGVDVSAKFDRFIGV